MSAGEIIGPVNLDAEAALLGAMMIDNRIIDRVLDRCEPSDMGDALHGRIFDAIVRQQGLGRKATPVTLRPIFETDPAMMELGGPGYLATLTANGVGLLAADDFADQIRELAKLRRMRAHVAEALKRIDAGGADPAKVAADLEAAAWDASDSEESVSEMSFADAVQLTVDRQKRINSGTVEKGMMCATICDLNDLTGGLQPGWMTVIAGRPGSGKTSVATSAAAGYAMSGHATLVISLEMGKDELGQRAASDVAHMMGYPVAHAAIREGRLNKEDLDRVMIARDRLAKLPLYLVDASGMTLGRLAATVRRWKRKLAAKGEKLELVIVDYLQLLTTDKRSENRVQEVSEVSRGIKQLAKREGVCIVALSQLNRDVEKRDDKRPMLSDLKESSQIEADADAIIFLFREEYYLRMSKPPEDKPDKLAKWEGDLDRCENRIEFIAAKLRHGQPGTRTGFFFGQNQAVRGSDFYARARA